MSNKFSLGNLKAMYRMQEKGMNPIRTSSPDIWLVPSENSLTRVYTVRVRLTDKWIETRCNCMALTHCKHERYVHLEFNRSNKHLIDLMALESERKAA